MKEITLILSLRAAAICGYIAVILIIHLEKRKLKSDNQGQGASIISEAERQAKLRNEHYQIRLESKLQDESEELESDILGRSEDLKVTESDLDSQEEFARKEQSRVDRKANEIANHQNRTDQAALRFGEMNATLEQQRVELIQVLETTAGLAAQKLKDQRRDDLIREQQLDSQRVLQNIEEEISLSAKRRGTRMLHRVQARYAPTFVWPKSVNSVEIKTARIEQQLHSDQTNLIQNLRELTEHVTIELLEKSDENYQPNIKLVGGFGVYREAARLTLEELLAKPPALWSKVELSYRKHLAELDRQAIRLGHEAMVKLKIKPVHPEILRMVGNLNWRTSYRQNQYLHTLEVAQLAGILAAEIGVDPELAKRSGLIHDIGKTIDYRIEGSHAVISGDYGDRYGEKRVVCDTAMSHHNDLVLETPLSYVLKAADTLSGARPGARVNLEEGYQIRLASIEEAVRSFRGVQKLAIMNGGREVHVEVQTGQIREGSLQELSTAIARKIEEQVAYPGQIKVLVTRRFEAVAVA